MAPATRPVLAASPRPPLAALRGLVLLGVIVLAGLAGAADKPQSRAADSRKAAAAQENKEKSAPARGFDKLKLPANAVVVVCEKFEDALRLVPSLIILTPDKYKKLLE